MSYQKEKIPALIQDPTNVSIIIWKGLGVLLDEIFSTSFPSQMLPQIRVLVCLQPSEILLRYNINPNLDHNFHIATVLCNLSLIVKFEECRANKSGNTQTKVIQ